MFLAILLIKVSKRDFLGNNKGQVTGPEGIEIIKCLFYEGTGRRFVKGCDWWQVIVTVDGTDRAAGVGVDISLDSIAVGGTERVAGGGQTAVR